MKGKKMTIEKKEVLLKNGQRCILRSPSLDDAEQLIDFLKVSAAETDFLSQYPEELNITDEKEKDILQWFIDSKKDLMIIAEINGKVVGNCTFSPIGQKVRIRHRCSIGMALYEKVWGLGIGTALLSLLIENAIGCGYEQMELDVVSRNDRAIKLYEKMGFVRCGNKPRAMKHKDGTYDNVIMMVRQLSHI